MMNKTLLSLIIVTKVLACYKQSKYFVFLSLPYLKKVAQITNKKIQSKGTY